MSWTSRCPQIYKHGHKLRIECAGSYAPIYVPCNTLLPNARALKLGYFIEVFECTINTSSYIPTYHISNCGRTGSRTNDLTQEYTNHPYENTETPKNLPWRTFKAEVSHPFPHLSLQLLSYKTRHFRPDPGCLTRKCRLRLAKVKSLRFHRRASLLENDFLSSQWGQINSCLLAECLVS
jgi:hypothetical protein